jgi:hypothetical protein
VEEEEVEALIAIIVVSFGTWSINKEIIVLLQQTLAIEHAPTSLQHSLNSLTKQECRL